MTQSYAVAGTVAEFNSTSFAIAIATVAAVPASSVKILSVTSGSVNVDLEIRADSASASSSVADSLTSLAQGGVAAASAALGIDFESISTPEAAVTILPGPMPPPSLPSALSPPPPLGLDDGQGQSVDDGDDSSSPVMVIIIVVIGVVLVLVLAFFCRRFGQRRTRFSTQKRPKDTFGSLFDDMNSELELAKPAAAPKGGRASSSRLADAIAADKASRSVDGSRVQSLAAAGELFSQAAQVNSSSSSSRQQSSSSRIAARTDVGHARIEGDSDEDDEIDQAITRAKQQLGSGSPSANPVSTHLDLSSAPGKGGRERMKEAKEHMQAARQQLTPHLTPPQPARRQVPEPVASVQPASSAPGFLPFRSAVPSSAKATPAAAAAASSAPGFLPFPSSVKASPAASSGAAATTGAAKPRGRDERSSVDDNLPLVDGDAPIGLTPDELQILMDLKRQCK